MPMDFRDTRIALSEKISECQNHMKNNTFDEDTFKLCFAYFGQYTTMLAQGNPDMVDTGPIKEITDYYNNHSAEHSYNYLTGTYGDRIYHYSSSSSSSSDSKKDDRNEDIKMWLSIGAIALFSILVLRSCAHSETMDEYLKKASLVDKNGKKIEFFDSKYVKGNEQETINPLDFPKTR